jgi:hypothetical protein
VKPVTDDQRVQFEEASRPLIKWMAENCHPHTAVLVDSVSAELFEGQLTFCTEQYVVGRGQKEGNG